MSNAIDKSLEGNQFLNDISNWFCIDCKKPTKGFGKRCQSCAMRYSFKIGILNTKGKNNPMYGRKGKLNPAYKNGNSILHNCIVCGNQVKRKGSMRCQKCYFKTRPLVKSHYKKFFYKNIYFKSSYEYKYAKYLDENKIKWQYESKTFDLGNTTYTPDFYLPESDTYVEIKGWLRPVAERKFLLFKKLFYNINIKMFMKEDLKQIGVL